MTGNAAEDVSTKCKQQHGEKIIEKSLPGRTGELGEVSPTRWLLPGVCRETSGILAIKTLAQKSYRLHYGNISELEAKSSTFCTWHCMNTQGEDWTKSLNRQNLGKLRDRAAGNLLSDSGAAHRFSCFSSHCFMHLFVLLFGTAPSSHHSADTSSPGRAGNLPKWGTPMASHCKMSQGGEEENGWGSGLSLLTQAQLASETKISGPS